MSQTWIVSNRLPWTCGGEGENPNQLVRSPGGLVAAMLPVHQAEGAYWVGHGGFPSDLPGLEAILMKDRLVDVPISAADYAAYYNGASNGCLWPIFHYFPAIANFDEANWEAYRRVNHIFAKILLERVRPGDLVWIHDYQLMLLPRLLREVMPDLRIGYFHHIPFPASEVFKLLPWREEILEGLLGADLVGFHTLEYARHFGSVSARILGLEIRGENIHHGDRIVRTGAFPLGIDTDGILGAMQSDMHQITLAELNQTFAGRKLVLGVDRLDYTKGIRERLEAFACYLRLHPEASKNTVLMLLCVPSRVAVNSYATLRQEIEQLVGRINGEYGTTANQPVHYLFQSRSLPELTALYRRADVCLVTPLRDGLNLVCKEYCAVRHDLGGMLIISEFAGASEELGEALIVNPFDTQGVAKAIHSALTMDDKERKTRMSALRQRVLEANNQAWAGLFIATLDEVAELNLQHMSRCLENPQEVLELLNRLKAAPQILAVIDDNAFTRRHARPQELDQLLVKLQARFGDRLVALVITGESVQTARVRPGIWLTTECGACLYPPMGSPIKSAVTLADLGAYRPEIMRILIELGRKIPRSRLIESSSSIAWTMGATSSDMAKVLLNETRHAITTILERSPWFCANIHHGLIVRCSTFGPAQAVELVLTQIDPENKCVLLTIGDRYTDEGLFKLQEERNCSVAIATPATTAQYLIADAPSFLEVVSRTDSPS